MRIAPFAAFKSFFVISDEQAMWRVQTNEDAQAFAHLVRRWERPVQNLCARMTGDVHRAEDLAQDIFARIFSKRAEYRPEAKFSTWLWRIALNRCYDELRREQLRRERSVAFDSEDDIFTALDAPAAEPGPDGAAMQREDAQRVREALLKLPETYRSVVVLRHYEALKFREIAQVLNIPEGTVKSRMAEAMTQLARLLQTTVVSNPSQSPAPAGLPKQLQSSML
jgi:RNA polymerase sigma-70 factor (ECF subfamily)